MDSFSVVLGLTPQSQSACVAGVYRKGVGESKRSWRKQGKLFLSPNHPPSITPPPPTLLHPLPCFTPATHASQFVNSQLVYLELSIWILNTFMSKFAIFVSCFTVSAKSTTQSWVHFKVNSLFVTNPHLQCVTKVVEPLLQNDAFDIKKESTTSLSHKWTKT